MEIFLNGKREFSNAKTITELLISKGISKENFNHIIVEHNYTIVKTENWDKTLLTPNDNIEILKLVGGG